METTFQPVLLLTDSCASEYAPGKGKGKDVLEAPHAGGRGAKEDEAQNIQQGDHNLDAKEQLLDDRKYRSLPRASAFEDCRFVPKSL